MKKKVFNYGYSPEEDENKNQQQLQEEIVLLVSAYDKKLVHKLFRNLLG
ncbi:MAG: hypothetical protein NY202_04970 [Mollicutes bacterium UO1]